MLNYTDPYLEKYLDITKEHPIPFTERKTLIKKYSFAITGPTPIQELVLNSPIIEMGAGSGYWAAQITAAGGNVIAFDKSQPLENKYGFTEQWFPIDIGGPEVIADHTHRTLFLCWPSYRSNFAKECLDAYEGNTLIYIGEPKGGACANDAFFDAIDTDWVTLKWVDIHTWPGVHDEMTIFKREQ